MTSPLLARLTALFEEGHAREVTGLRDDSHFAARANRPAAVLMAVTDRADEPGFLMIHRPSHMRAHPGQVAFPGGKIDPGETAVEAALREANEELGIDPRDVQVIGTTDRYRTGTGYDITPVLAMVPADLPIIPNPAEVARWFEPPVGFVMDHANHTHHTAEWDATRRRYIEIMWQGHRIWGVTAAIIANLTRRIAWHEEQRHG
jgi:8-oxo-dGTP pyrophosphatase MutT (NUDIX family)